MGKLEKYRILLLVAGLVLALAISFQSFLMITIIEPVALLFWAIWRILASVDQNVYWTILIVLCAALMLRLVPSGKDFSPRPAYNYEYKSLDRVEYWRRLMKEAASGKDGNENLHHSLENLLMSTIAQADHSLSTDPAEAVASGQVSLPPAIRRFLLLPGEEQEALSGHHQFNPLVLASKWFRRWAGPRDRQDRALVEEVLQWMESYLEISHDQ